MPGWQGGQRWLHFSRRRENSLGGKSKNTGRHALTMVRIVATYDANGFLLRYGQ